MRVICITCSRSAKRISGADYLGLAIIMYNIWLEPPLFNGRKTITLTK